MTTPAIQTYDELFQEYADERTKQEYRPVQLGFGTLDDAMRGISAGQVCGVAARTAVGKTWMLGTIEHNFAGRGDAACLSLSLEMPGTEWAERALAMSSDVPPYMVEEWAKQGELGERATDFLERMRHTLVVDSAVRLEQLPELFRLARERLEVPLRLVVVDYLGLLKTSGKDAYERASAVGFGLKDIAKAEKVAIIVAMQLNRAAGDGSEPVSIEMLRDSGVLEENLDFLIGAWRPEKKTGLGPVEREEVRDVMRVKLLKNRKGADGQVVDLAFHKESRRLFEPSDLDLFASV